MVSGSAGTRHLGGDCEPPGDFDSQSPRLHPPQAAFAASGETRLEREREIHGLARGGTVGAPLVRQGVHQHKAPPGLGVGVGGGERGVWCASTGSCPGEQEGASVTVRPVWWVMALVTSSLASRIATSSST